MQMRLTKNSQKKHTIEYRRDDGSRTWMHADGFFVRHDLSHFAVEKILGFRTGFMGMLNAGMQVQDFEDREKRSKIPLTPEAIHAENMANLFLIEVAQGNFEDFNSTVQSSFNSFGHELDPPVLRDAEIGRIRTYYRELLRNWDRLPVGQKLSLDL
jgi:hypothetical protein